MDVVDSVWARLFWLWELVSVGPVSRNYGDYSGGPSFEAKAGGEVRKRVGMLYRFIPDVNRIDDLF